MGPSLGPGWGVSKESPQRPSPRSPGEGQEGGREAHEQIRMHTDTHTRKKEEQERRIFRKTAEMWRRKVEKDRQTHWRRDPATHMRTQRHTPAWGWDKEKDEHLMRPLQGGGMGGAEADRRQTDGHTGRARRRDTDPGSHGSPFEGGTGLGTRWEEPSGGDVGTARAG